MQCWGYFSGMKALKKIFPTNWNVFTFAANHKVECELKQVHVTVVIIVLKDSQTQSQIDSKRTCCINNKDMQWFSSGLCVCVMCGLGRLWMLQRGKEMRVTGQMLTLVIFLSYLLFQLRRAEYALYKHRAFTLCVDKVLNKHRDIEIANTRRDANLHTRCYSCCLVVV